MGTVSRVGVFPQYPLASFLLSNGIHTAVEINERQYRNGEVVESTINHVVDILAFLLGWIICHILSCVYEAQFCSLVRNVPARVIISVFLIVVTAKEIKKR